MFQLFRHGDRAEGHAVPGCDQVLLFFTINYYYFFYFFKLIFQVIFFSSPKMIGPLEVAVMASFHLCAIHVLYLFFCIS